MPKKQTDTLAKEKNKEYGSDAPLTILAFVQDFTPEHWKWTKKELESLGDPKKMWAVIFKRLQKAGIEVTEAYAIIHDRDETELWNTYKNEFIVCGVAEHIHFLVKLNQKKSAKLERLAEIIGIRPSQIEKPKAGGATWYNLLAYMIHIKYDEKFRYLPTDVIDLAGNFHYMDYYQKKEESWLRSRAVIINRKAQLKWPVVEMALMNGEMTFSQLFNDPDYKYFCQKHIKKLLDLSRQLSGFDKAKSEILCNEIEDAALKKKVNEFVNSLYASIIPNQGILMTSRDILVKRLDSLVIDPGSGSSTKDNAVSE